MRRKILVLAAVGLLKSGATSAADFPEGDARPFQLEASWAWDSFDTSARLDVDLGGILSAGTSVDFENLVGVPAVKAHFRGLGRWRLSDASSLELGLDSVSRGGARVLAEEIVWEGTTYGVGAEVEGTFDSDEAYLGYRWDAFRAANVRLGGTIGVSYYRLATSLSGRGEVTKPDGTVEQGTFTRAFDLAAPVPVVGLAGEGAVSRRVVFGFYSRCLFLSTSGLSGGTISGGLSLRWYASPAFAIVGGADVSSIRIRKYVDGDRRYSGSYTYAGPRIGLSVGF